MDEAAEVGAEKMRWDRKAILNQLRIARRASPPPYKVCSGSGWAGTS